MFERIRLFYEKGLWTAGMVRQAVDKGLLSEEQYRQIVGPQPGSGEAEAAPVQEKAGSPTSGTEVSGNG